MPRKPLLHDQSHAVQLRLQEESKARQDLKARERLAKDQEKQRLKQAKRQPPRIPFDLQKVAYTDTIGWRAQGSVGERQDHGSGRAGNAKRQQPDQCSATCGSRKRLCRKPVPVHVPLSHAPLIWYATAKHITKSCRQRERSFHTWRTRSSSVSRSILFTDLFTNITNGPS